MGRLHAILRLRSFGVVCLVLASTSFAQRVTDVDAATIAGRVCEDVDGDGQCSADEPGIPNARIATETGISAVTDARGRYHLTGLPARAPDTSLGELRLVPGRHRVKLDARSVSEGAVVSPNGATLEVPVGGLTLQNFAVTVPPSSRTPIGRAANAPPKGELGDNGGLSLQVSGQVAPGAAVMVAGRPAEVDADGTYRAWVQAGEGLTLAAIRVQHSATHFSYSTQRIDVVRRQDSGALLVVPQPPKLLAVVTVTPSPGRGTAVLLEAPAGTRVRIGSREAVASSAGRASIELTGTDDELPIHLESGGSVIDDRLPVSAGDGVSAVGLLDLEAGYLLGAGGGFRLQGRGAGSIRARKWGFELGAEIDLRDTDVRAMQQGGAAAVAPLLTQPRDAVVLDRWIDPLRVSPQWGDDSVTQSTNPGEQRLRVELSRPGLGRVGYGTHRAWFGDSEIGRVHRAITGAYLELHSPEEKLVHGGINGFYAAPTVDPLAGLNRTPGHERFESTGGSLYYLSSGQVVQGSELVRVEVREQLSGVPVRERHLQRGVDYAIDYVSGRILLTRPLSLFEGTNALGAEPLSASRTPVLVVDYERYDLGPSTGRVAGGEGELSIGPVTISAGAAQDADASLFRGRAFGKAGPVSLTAEVARSAGFFAGQSWSTDGGLSFLRADAATLAQLPTDAWAMTFRATGPMVKGGGFDVSFRRRNAGFSDSQHLDTARFQQLSARVAQPLGPVLLNGFFDDRTSADPRSPYSLDSVGQRLAGGGVSFDRSMWGVRLEARDTQIVADGLTGGRTSVGASARLSPVGWLTLVAAHKQRILERGEGIGSFNDSFSTLGFDLRPSDDVMLGVRGGWGPALGPQVWGQAAVRDGQDTYYAGQSVDVDGPSVGEQRFASGVRRSVGPGSVVFVEDVVSHDATALRLGRAIGLSQDVAPGLTFSARYERGLAQQLDVLPTMTRDAGGVGLSLIRKRVRAWLRAEARADRGAAPDHLQMLATGGGEVELLQNLRATVMASFTHTTAEQRLVQRLLEGTAAIAWRSEWLMMVLRYGLRRELLPPSRGGFVEQTHHLLALLPTLKLGNRFALAAGGYLGLTDVVGQPGVIVSASLRPSVRVVAGAEVAAEVVRRSAAPDGEGLTSLRGEVGYRFNEQFFLGAGYAMLGFSGNGVEPNASPSRVYLRAEAAY